MEDDDGVCDSRISHRRNVQVQEYLLETTVSPFSWLYIYVHEDCSLEEEAPSTSDR